MTLSFITKWPDSMPKHLAGTPTYFPEKIWRAISDHEITQELANFLHSEQSTGRNIMDLAPKKHTIRFLTADQYKKWCKPNRVIHFKIWTGKPYKDKTLQFAPVLPVKVLEYLRFEFYLGYIKVFVEDEWMGDIFHHGIDDIYEYVNPIRALAINDGFENIEDFFAYFTEERVKAMEAQGKHPYIIHWTDLKYKQ